MSRRYTVLDWLVWNAWWHGCVNWTRHRRRA